MTEEWRPLPDVEPVCIAAPVVTGIGEAEVLERLVIDLDADPFCSHIRDVFVGVTRVEIADCDAGQQKSARAVSSQQKSARAVASQQKSARADASQQKSARADASQQKSVRAGASQQKSARAGASRGPDIYVRYRGNPLGPSKVLQTPCEGVANGNQDTKVDRFRRRAAPVGGCSGGG